MIKVLTRQCLYYTSTNLVKNDKSSDCRQCLYYTNTNLVKNYKSSDCRQCLYYTNTNLDKMIKVLTVDNVCITPTQT